MVVADVFDEARLGLGDVEQGLSRFGRVTEGDEVGRVAGAQALADFRILLEPTDAGAVATTWVDDDHRAAPFVYRQALRRENAQQGIVDRMGQVASVDQYLVGELQDQRVTGALVGQGVVAALA